MPRLASEGHRAPTPVTALLHAVAVVKSGAFAILRFTYFSYGTEFLRGSAAQWVVMAAAMVTIIFGSTMQSRRFTGNAVWRIPRSAICRIFCWERR